MTPQLLRFSMLATYARCPEKFRRQYVEGIEEPGITLYRDAGTLFHEAVEQVPEDADEQTLATAITHLGERHDRKTTARALDRVAAWAAFTKADAYPEVVAREPEINHRFTWSTPYEERPLRYRGHVDRVMSDNDGGLVIDDWKLGQPSPSHVTQLQLYAPVVAEQFGRPVTWCRVIYLKPESNYTVTAFLPATSLNDVELLMGGAAQAMAAEGDNFPAWGSLTNACRSCGFAASCHGASFASVNAVQRKE